MCFLPTEMPISLFGSALAENHLQNLEKESEPQRKKNQNGSLRFKSKLFTLTASYN